MGTDNNPLMLMWGLTLVVCFVVSAAGLRLASRRYRCLPDDAHWTERARLLWPLRIARIATIIWIPLGMGIFGPSANDSGSYIKLYATAAGLAGVLMGARVAFMGLKVPNRAWAMSLRARAVLILVMSPLLLIIVLMVLMLGHSLDSTAIAVAVGGLCFSLVWTLGLGLWLCAKLGVLRPASENLRLLAQRVSDRLGVPLRHVYEIEIPSANAFAFTASGDIGITKGAIEILPDDEMEAVVAHELGHLKELPAVKRLRFLGLLPFSLMILYGPVTHTWGLKWGFGILVAIVLFRRAMMKFRRSAEKDADAVAKTDETSSGTYARALEHLYEANLAPAMIAGATTHPNLYDRMIEAGVTPAYPRPAPSTKWQGWAWAGAMTGVTCFAIVELMRWLGPQP